MEYSFAKIVTFEVAKTHYFGMNPPPLPREFSFERWGWGRIEACINKFISDARVKDTYPSFIKSEIDFLQFLYELNIICYFERRDDGAPMFCWCYRERDLSKS